MFHYFMFALCVHVVYGKHFFVYFVISICRNVFFCITNFDYELTQKFNFVLIASMNVAPILSADSSFNENVKKKLELK